jgi:hypothetical protein
MSQVYRFSKEVGKLKRESLLERISVRAGPITRLVGSGENFVVPVATLDVKKTHLQLRTVKKID